MRVLLAADADPSVRNAEVSDQGVGRSVGRSFEWTKQAWVGLDVSRTCRWDVKYVREGPSLLLSIPNGVVIDDE